MNRKRILSRNVSGVTGKLFSVLVFLFLFSSLGVLGYSYDETILGVGLDKGLWTRKTLNSNWVPVPNSGSVISVAVMKNGAILGVGLDKGLWTRKTLHSDWVPVPNSGSVIDVAVGTLKR